MAKKAVPPQALKDSRFKLPWPVVCLLALVCILGGGAIWNGIMLRSEAEIYLPPGVIIPNVPLTYSTDDKAAGGTVAVSAPAGGTMHAYVTGEKTEGEPTIVMLGGWGTTSPVLDYQPLIAPLRSQGKIIALERPGYGWSGASFSPRTLDNMVSDTLYALTYLGDTGPYVLVAQGTAGLEAIHFAYEYPWMVSGIVFINAPPPAVYSYRMDLPLYYLKAYTYPVPRVIGIFRAIGTFLPESFLPGLAVDMEAYNALFYRNCMSNAMRMEAHNLAKNAKSSLTEAAYLEVPNAASFIYTPDYGANEEITRVWDAFNSAVGAAVYYNETDPELQHAEIPAISQEIMRLVREAPPMVVPEPESPPEEDDFVFPEVQLPDEQVTGEQLPDEQLPDDTPILPQLEDLPNNIEPDDFVPDDTAAV